MAATILVDTREQKPLRFRSPTKRATLKEGDYSITGCSGKGGIVVERKSLNDLYGTMLKSRARFRRELRRMAIGGYGFTVVVVESSFLKVRRGHRLTTANGELVARMFLADCMEHGVAAVFCSGRVEAAVLVESMLLAYRDGKVSQRFADARTRGVVGGEGGTKAAKARTHARVRARR